MPLSPLSSPPDARALLRALFERAVLAARPERSISAHLPPPPRGRTVVLGAGKAAAGMARAVEAAWPEKLDGLVVTRYGHAGEIPGAPASRIEIVEAGHPVPDAAGLAAAARMMALVEDLGPDDLVLALVSGGGSALLPAPAPGLTLSDEQALARALLASGAPIGVMNLIRNQVSTIKGGRLAVRAAPARIVTLIVSDVPGDDPALVASGPTVPMVGTRALARHHARLLGLDLPAPVRALLASEENLAPAPDDPVFARNLVKIIASAALSLEAAAALARERGIAPVILSDAIEGEAREAGRMLAALAREIALRGRPFAPPVVLLSGGETSVTLRGAGRGGRNGEFALGLALGIEGVGGIAALAADTDGIDGSEDNAGAFVDGDSVARMRAAGIDPALALAENDSHAAFAAIGDLLVTGPTGTNVNDFRAILVR